MVLLILNAGSSSLKFSLVDPEHDRTWTQGSVDAAVSEPESLASAVAGIAGRMNTFVRSNSDAGAIDGVVHRVVHGGLRFSAPVRITADVRIALEELNELAPLHNRPALEVIDAALAALPGVPHIAAFDTAFHATLSPEAFTYPLPSELTVRWGLRRFGFHGLSHAYCAGRAAELLDRPPDGLQLVIAHLGSGASVTATRDGRSVDTSMGFTPLEGLMMGTRSGSVDPGLLLHLQLRCGMSAEELYHVLYHDSGILGVSGVSFDVRETIAAAAAGNAQAALAVQLFAHRARQAIGAAAVTLGRVDALVFTGGIGEHSAAIRALICVGLSCLGLEIDSAANQSAQPDVAVSSTGSPGRILVLTTREDLMMGRAAYAVLTRPSQPEPRP